MIRVLILDDDKRYADALKQVIDDFDLSGQVVSDIATTPDAAQQLALSAVHSGRPYIVFLLDIFLGAGKDGIEVMADLRKISPSSDVIFLTGRGDRENAIRAYKAGAFRYLSKPIEEEELIFVLYALLQSRRETIENHWRKVFSELIESAQYQNNFIDAAKVVVDHALLLGFKRAHLFWAPKRDENGIRSMFVGIDCSGEGYSPSFTKIKFHLNDKDALQSQVHTRDSVFIERNAENELTINEIESIGYQIPLSGLWLLPLWIGVELVGILILDFWQNHHYLGTHEKSLLDFFARQVSLTLERASMYNWQKRPLNVFLCHSKDDKEQVKDLYKSLSLQPNILPWFDEVDLLPGVEWDLEIEQAVKNSDIVIVCLSKKSLSKDGYIHKEIRLALDIAERKPEGTIYIIPLLLEDCIVPDRLGRWQWIKYFNKPHEQFIKLIKVLQKQSHLLDLKEN